MTKRRSFRCKAARPFSVEGEQSALISSPSSSRVGVIFLSVAYLSRNLLHDGVGDRLVRSVPVRNSAASAAQPTDQSSAAGAHRASLCARSADLRSETEIHRRHRHGLPMVDWPVTGSTAN